MDKMKEYAIIGQKVDMVNKITTIEDSIVYFISLVLSIVSALLISKLIFIVSAIMLIELVMKVVNIIAITKRIKARELIFGISLDIDKECSDSLDNLCISLKM